VTAISRAAASELRATGSRADCAVVRHVPNAPPMHSSARQEWRARWGLPQAALVIGMIGGVKPQKAYPRALRVLAALGARRDACLVIVGGPTGRDGALAWQAVLAQARRLGLESRVRRPGFIANAADCLPAFDLVLNTSRYEGHSVATLEALAAGLPVVASDVGGQGELSAPGLTLMPFDASEVQWTRAIEDALQAPPAPPAWRGAPAHRVWTLFHLLRPFEPRNTVLFVTANLNAGGAQRSLVNLALALRGSLDFEIAVCGDSSSAHFSRALEHAGVQARRSAASRDCFDHAESILRHVVAQRFGTVCFWNVDAKVKLLLAKPLGTAGVRLIDVSPGGYSFDEMDATRAFQEWIAYTQDEYYARLDRFVLKYRGDAPRSMRGKITVIPNGVQPQEDVAAGTKTTPPRIVMSGRIAPSKFLLEAVAAMRLLWCKHPHAELHLLGTAEQRHAAYARSLLDDIGPELGVRIFLHGASFDSPDRLAGFTLALVLGQHQGCPNAVLEALAAGVPVVANDSGGTRELIKSGRTGLLLAGREPHEIAAALARIITDGTLAKRLSAAGRRHARRRFSMKRMAAGYIEVLTST
jgi:glycosyltransferase involved in cell wall biosynthesis